MEGEGEDDGPQQPDIDPGRHPDQGLVLRQTVLTDQNMLINLAAQRDIRGLDGSYSIMLERSNKNILASSQKFH